jgi:chemotaxis-related protein WspD
MSTLVEDLERPAAAACWHDIGVLGDGSCPELAYHVHCRNCPRHAAAAVALLERDVSPAYVAEQTRHFSAAVASAPERDLQSVLVFRLAAEWLALPTAVVQEVADVRPVHALPHRRAGALLGVASVRGELLPAISLTALLNLQAAAPDAAIRAGIARQLVLRLEDVRAVCPVNEVDGTRGVSAAAMRDVPATVTQARQAFSRGVTVSGDRAIGILDPDALLPAIRRSLA